MTANQPFTEGAPADSARLHEPVMRDFGATRGHAVSRYAALADHLRALGTTSVRLSFSDVEAIIGAHLPPSAFRHHAWWSNSRTDDTHIWAHLWLRAGWEKSGVNFAGRWVEFRRLETYEIESQKAREGYELDRTILARTRNVGLSDRRKQRDNYTCQACGFRLQIDTRFVIEVHHCDPLSVTGERETSIDDLVSLCPTCHRIAHLRSTPYSVTEIRELISSVREVANI